MRAPNGSRAFSAADTSVAIAGMVQVIGASAPQRIVALLAEAKKTA
jgi:hypothetical protein